MSNTSANEQPGGKAFEARRKGTLDLVRELDRQSRLRPNELRAEVMPTLQRMLAHAVTNSAWWRDRLKDVTPFLREAANFNELLDLVPITTQQQLSEYSTWMAAWVPGSNANMYGVRMKAQMSAPPIRVVQFAPEFLNRNQAAQLLGATWSKVDFARPLVVYGAQGQPRKLETQGTPMSFLGKVGSVEFINSENTSHGELLDHIAAQKTAVLQVSALELAQLLQQQVSSPRKLKLDQVVVSDSILATDYRQQVKRVLGARLINHLESDLFGVMAVECRAGDHLHPLNSHNYIEVLDENNRRAEVGQIGRLALTSLSNPGFPIFRYELGINVEVGTACPKEIGAPSLIPATGA